MKILTVVGFALASAACFAEMEPASPESQGMDSQAILNWIDACEQTFDGAKEGRLHGFVIVRHGKTISEGTWKPFDTLNEPHMLYSHSKSFTSSAIGFLVDDGRLDLDERLVDIFPEAVPPNPSENLRQLRVRDLLTMNAGKKDHLLRDGGDWVKEFFAMDFAQKPGTCFKYDSDATYMLAALVERRSGKKLMDFLKERMFDRIGITSAWTTTSPQGIACGGWGMHMTTRDLARFGQLYLQQGEWNGEFILSPYWCSLATMRHTWSGWQNVGVKALGTGGDWEQGYGVAATGRSARTARRASTRSSCPHSTSSSRSTRGLATWPGSSSSSGSISCPVPEMRRCPKARLGRICASAWARLKSPR